MAPKVLSASKASEDAVEVAKLVRKSPLTRARPRVPAQNAAYIPGAARARLGPPPKATGARARDFGDDVDRLEPLRRDRGVGPEPALDIMLRHLKKFTVYSSVIVAGQASRALDNAPFAGQDESEDAKVLLRRLSDCDDDEVHIFGDCYDPDETHLRVPRVPDARRAARPTLGVAGTSSTTRSTARSRPRSASSRR